MNKETTIIINELKKAGLISNDSDLTANDKTNFIFDYMVKHYSYLLENDIDKILSEEDFKKGNIIHKIIIKYGKYFLKNPQIIENRRELLSGDMDTFAGESRDKMKDKIELPEEPVIFITNHGFKDDVLATMIAAERRAFILFGSLPQFYGTFDGLLSAKNGVVMVNRKVEQSRNTSVEKGKYVLENGMSLMICPEGVWNKTPNLPLLDFWSGFYRIAKKDDGTFYPIVPIVHYINNTHKSGKDNPIHTIVDDPIYLDGLNEKEAIEYIRTRMLTWYWKLMEVYGQDKRERLLKGYTSATEAWEDELRERVKTATKYDKEIEYSADRISSEKRKNDALVVWEPIASIEPTKENILDVMYAKKLVKEYKTNDFQHRF